MSNEEKVIVESLPYYVNVENVEKLIESIKKKQGDEKAIKTLFGEGKYNECKRALVIFGIISQEMMFTERGKNIAYSIDESNRILEWRKVIKSVAAYDNFLNYYILNRKGQSLCDLEIVKNFWAQKNICKSDAMRKDAAVTFGNILALANLGSFKKGKQGNSRIELDLQELDKYCNNYTDTNIESINDEVTIEQPINVKDTESANVNVLSTAYESRSVKLQTTSSTVVNINISININTADELREVIKILNDKGSQS